MRKHALGMIALIALAGPALSADLGQGDGDSAPVGPNWSWTSCYVGGRAGGLWGSSEKWIVRTPGGAFFGKSLGGHDVDSWTGGVQVGCDYQLDRVVLGIRGDYDWTDAEGSHDSTREFGVAYHSEVEALASVTGRVGYAWERALGYVKGGIAWERDDYSASTILVGTAYTASDTRSGWTVGVGGEYAITGSLSVFAEYGYYDFGPRKVRLTPRLAGLRPAFVDIAETANVVRAGLNLRFGR